jgi:hypothetical protein
VDRRRWHSGRQLNPRVEAGRLKGTCRVELDKLMRKSGRIAGLLGFGGHGRIALMTLRSRGSGSVRIAGRHRRCARSDCQISV